MSRVVYVCDFDGTISPVDIGAAFARRFSVGGEREVQAALERWRDGSLGSRELTEIQCRWLSVDEPVALDFVREFSLDPDFGEFVTEALARGEQVMVASDGFEFYVRDHLERAGWASLAWVANRTRFEAGRVIPEFPHFDSGCGRCGNCKGAHVAAKRLAGHRVVLIGDGTSDRCGALAADLVWAKGDLLAWCRREWLQARAFEGFAEVRRLARELDRKERTGAAIDSNRSGKGL